MLQPLLESKPNPGLSLTSPVGSAISIVQTESIGRNGRASRDINGYSVAFRMALYTSRLLSNGEQLQNLPADVQVEILWLLSVTQLLASDQLGLQEDNKLWSTLKDPVVENEVQKFLGSVQAILPAMLSRAADWRHTAPDSPPLVPGSLVAKLIHDSKGTSPSAFYAARVLGNILTSLVEAHGWKAAGGDEWLSSLDVLKASTPSVFTVVALLTGLQEVIGTSKLVNTLCNRFVSDITGASPKQEKTLVSLIMLNATLAVYESGNLPVAQNRIVFAVKHMTSWMAADESLATPLATEVCRSLQILLPSMKEVYGSYWETAVNFCVSLWTKKQTDQSLDELLPTLHASLRLITLLQNLQDPNDDLAEVLTDSAESISTGLLELLRLPRNKENQPWRIFDELLCRRVADIPENHIKDLSMIYPLVASDYRYIQLAAFNILNRAIPAAQAQISVDVLLEKTGKPCLIMA